MATDLKGKMAKEIALMVLSGEITQKEAEEFVAARAISKFQRELEKAAAPS